MRRRRCPASARSRAPRPRSREWRRLRCHDQRDADWSRPLGS